MKQRTTSIYDALLLGTSRSLRSLSTKDILGDRRSFMRLVGEIKRREEKLDTAVEILSRIRLNDSIIVLLDTDIIRKYMEIDSARTNESEYIRYFFEAGSFTYALPSGTWEELLRYLSNLLPPHASTLSDPSILQDLTKRPEVDVLSTIEAQVGARHTTIATQQRAMMIEQQVARLSRITAPPRFDKTLYVESDPLLLEKLIFQVESEERYDRLGKFVAGVTDREARDRCDAQNMSIAYTQLFRKETNALPDGPHYLLLTTTRPVLNAAKAFDEDALFVISPESFVMASELYKLHGHAGALTRARLLHAKVAKCRQLLLDHHSSVPDTDPEALLRHASELEDSIRTLYPGGLLEIERSVTALRGTTHVNERQGALEPLDFGFPSRTMHLRKVLDRIVEDLLALKNIQYNRKPTAIKRHKFGYKEYMIGLGIDTSAQEELCLRIYFDSPTAKKAQRTFWTASWVVECDDSQFLSALDNSFPPSPIAFSGVKAFFPADYVCCPIQTDLEWHAQEILVVTSIGVFGIRRKIVDDEGTWQCLTLPRLRRMASYFSTAVGAGSEDIPSIEEVRLRLDDMEITFDFVPLEGKVQRSCVVTSSKDCAAVVASLYADIGPRLVSESALANCLARELVSRN